MPAARSPDQQHLFHEGPVFHEGRETGKGRQRGATDHSTNPYAAPAAGGESGATDELAGADEMLRQVEDLIGTRCAGVLRRTFADMEVAEEALEGAMVRAQRHGKLKLAREIDRAFLDLMPSPAMRPYRRDLYRRHCRELIRRIETAGSYDGADLEAPTRAEMLIVLARASELAPLHRSAFAAYVSLFKSLYGPAVPEALRPYNPQELASYDGALERTLDDVRRAAEDLAEERHRKTQHSGKQHSGK